MKIDPSQSATDAALAGAVRDTIPISKSSDNGDAAALASQIVASGIENATRPMTHLYEFRAWFTPPGVRLPIPETVVTSKVCAPDWETAVTKVRAWLAASCLANKLAADAYEISFVAAKELDLPLT